MIEATDFQTPIHNRVNAYGTLAGFLFLLLKKNCYSINLMYSKFISNLDLKINDLCTIHNEIKDSRFSKSTIKIYEFKRRKIK